VVSNRDGRLYITDYGNNRLVRIDDIAGAGWMSLSGTGGGSFSRPTGIFVQQYPWGPG
jgi:hypothetical protein